ncbi:MAG: hypothetical protein V3W41_22485 [Planctomycetota bacterium]
MAKKLGLGAAVAIVHEERACGAANDEAAPVQATLPLAELGDMSVKIDGNGKLVSLTRGPGRPKGARNKTTDDMVKYLRARYADPLEFLAQTISRPVEVLAKEIGCKTAEALARQITAAGVLLPYIHSRQPQTLQVEGADFVLMINTGANLTTDEARQAITILEGDLVDEDDVALPVVPDPEPAPQAQAKPPAKAPARKKAKPKAKAQAKRKPTKKGEPKQ